MKCLNTRADRCASEQLVGWCDDSRQLDGPLTNCWPVTGVRHDCCHCPMLTPWGTSLVLRWVASGEKTEVFASLGRSRRQHGTQPASNEILRKRFVYAPNVTIVSASVVAAGVASQPGALRHLSPPRYLGRDCSRAVSWATMQKAVPSRRIDNFRLAMPGAPCQC